MSDDITDDVDLNSEYHRGYAVGYKAANSQCVPVLSDRIEISTPLFLMDDKGTAWWIDPHAKVCKKV